MHTAYEIRSQNVERQIKLTQKIERLMNFTLRIRLRSDDVVILRMLKTDIGMIM